MTEDVSRWTQRALLLFQNDTPYDTWMQHVIVLSASTSEWMVSQIPEEILLSLMALMMLGHSPSVIRTPAPELPTELVLDSKVQAVTQAILECIATFPHSTSSEIFLGLMATFWGAEELYFRIRSRERELELSVTTMRRLFGVDCGQELERMELADEAIEVIRGTLSALPPKVRYGVILDLMQTGEGGKEVWYALKKREKILAEEEEWVQTMEHLAEKFDGRPPGTGKQLLSNLAICYNHVESALFLDPSPDPTRVGGASISRETPCSLTSWAKISKTFRMITPNASGAEFLRRTGYVDNFENVRQTVRIRRFDWRKWSAIKSCIL